MKRVAILLAAGVLGAAPVWAQQPSALHDIPWYVAHTAARAATLGWCHRDSSRANSFDCQNAEAAVAGTMFHDTGNRNPDDMTSPAYWTANPLARAGVLRGCARPRPGNAINKPYCGAASYSAAHDVRR